MREKKSLLVYHKEDNDGVFSAALIVSYLCNLSDEKYKYDFDDIELLGLDYNELMEKWNSGEVKEWPEKYENVFMTDISFSNWRGMEWLCKNMQHNFTWIDHHAPIINESKIHGFSSLNGNRATNKSAILLAYEYYYDPFNIKFNGCDFPQVLGALSAYDCWNWEGLGYDEEECKTINAAVNVIVKLDIIEALSIVSEIMDLKTGEDKEADNKWYQTLLQQGHSYRTYQKYEWANLMKSVDKTWKVGDRTAGVIFMQGPTNSMMFDTIKDEVQVGAAIKINTVNDTATISIYNTKKEYDEEFDCGAYCKQMLKGGGHKGAAGGTVKLNKLMKMMKTKTI